MLPSLCELTWKIHESQDLNPHFTLGDFIWLLFLTASSSFLTVLALNCIVSLLKLLLLVPLLPLICWLQPLGTGHLPVLPMGAPGWAFLPSPHSAEHPARPESWALGSSKGATHISVQLPP